MPALRRFFKARIRNGDLSAPPVPKSMRVSLSGIDAPRGGWPSWIMIVLVLPVVAGLAVSFRTEATGVSEGGISSVIRTLQFVWHRSLSILGATLN